MGVVEEINVKITGQVDGDMINIKKYIILQFETICAKYNLELEELT